MENSKLIQLLATFSAKEFRECGEWVSSPFVNKNEEVVLLYDHLRKLAPAFSPKKIGRETIYKNLFGKKPYDEKHINYLMSFLLKLIEKYLGYSYYTNDILQENIHVLQAYMERGLDKHYHYAYRQTKSKLKEYPYRNVGFFFRQYLLSEMDNQYFLRKKIRKYDERLQSAADYFDLFLTAGKLKYFCEMQDRKMTLAADYKLNMLPEISLAVQNNNFLEHPGIAAYWIVLQTQEQPQETRHFSELKKLLKKHAAAFPVAELRELYAYAINYCLRRINSGEQGFLKELFSLYRQTLEGGLLLENNRLSFWTYKNMVGVALRLSEFQWAEKFIYDYNSRLESQFQDNALHYNLAELYYYKHDFDSAMEHLNKVEFSDIYYSFDTKKMMMKIYFDKEEIDALLSLINSFRVFIKRNHSISAFNKRAYENFIQIIQQFLKYQTQRSAPELLENIKNTKPLADRNWLLEQYEKKFRK